MTQYLKKCTCCGEAYGVFESSYIRCRCQIKRNWWTGVVCFVAVIFACIMILTK